MDQPPPSYAPPIDVDPASPDQTAVPMETDAVTPVVQNPRDFNVLLEPIPHLEEDSVFTFNWTIPSWSVIRLQDKHYSEEFMGCGHLWRLMLFPSGNRSGDRISIFLESVEAGKEDKEKSKWHVCLQFAIIMSNPEDLKSFASSSEYTPHETDWGFNHFVAQRDLTHPSGDRRPLVENDRTTFTVYMRKYKDPTGVLWHSFMHYNSKAETGYVGLKNQGATCYMNSLLQSLYFTTYFRKATFQIPTKGEDPTKSIPLALQRVFYNLQFSDDPVGTIELTKSFGWDTHESFMQHDVQEFNRVLQDNLESKMKGTEAEGAISRLFVGKAKSYLKCINVDYESSRIEDFYDIQLNVKGCKTIKDSFDEYVAVETLEGDNKYQAEGFGLQDAKKGDIFQSFPPVLHLQLKRFEYDVMRDAMVKINDRHEFQPVINLDAYLAEDADKSVPQTYHLYGGDLHAGHYCAFIRPEKNGEWFKFDDDRVVRVTEREVFEENFGGDITAKQQIHKQQLKRFATNAYMLVYIRESDLDMVLAPVTVKDIPEHLAQMLAAEKEEEERRRREMEEAHLYMKVNLLTDELIKSHEGFDLCALEEAKNPGLPLTKLETFKVRREDSYWKMMEDIGKHFDIPPERLRLWTMVGRQNKTVRPDAPIPEAEYNMRMEGIREKYCKGMHEPRFYLEVSERPEGEFRNPQNGKIHYFLPKEDGNSPSIMIFLKYYDPLARKMQYVGHMTFSKNTRIQDIIPDLNKRMNFPLDTRLVLYEEVKPTMIDALNSKLTFQAAELGDGDIICFQKEHADPSSLADPGWADVTRYFDNIHSRVTVTFRPKARDQKDREGTFELTLSKKDTYDHAAKILAEKISADPAKIRLSSPQTLSAKQGLKRSPTLTVGEMLGPQQPVGNMMYQTVLHYEVLDVALSELDTKRYLKITFVDRAMKEHGPYDILLPKTAKIGELLSRVAEKIMSDPTLKAEPNGTGDVKIEPPNVNKLHLFETKDCKITKVYNENDPVQGIGGETPVLFAEEKPPEEETLEEGAKILNVFHFNKQPSQAHGVPFRITTKPGEMFSETKKRLQRRMSMNDKEFAKIKWAYVTGIGTFAKTKYLEDGDILSDLYTGNPGEHLGADHIDKSGKSSGLRGFEKAIKIFN
ncbi:hypothetical protein HK104_003759 [Borealophlyctis nickersoniae]|nr:hypothetical protein HK104_003759 [Borealophlyctis nickersoniae]